MRAYRRIDAPKPFACVKWAYGPGKIKGLGLARAIFGLFSSVFSTRVWGRPFLGGPEISGKKFFPENGRFFGPKSTNFLWDRQVVEKPALYPVFWKKRPENRGFLSILDFFPAKKSRIDSKPVFSKIGIFGPVFRHFFEKFRKSAVFRQSASLGVFFFKKGAEIWRFLRQVLRTWLRRRPP